MASTKANAKVARPGGSGTFAHPAKPTAGPTVFLDGTQMYRSDPQARIALIRQGIPASMIGNLAATVRTGTWR